VLLGFAGSYKGLTFLGLGLSAVTLVLGMAPYICIWLVARDLIAFAPDWTQAAGVVRYGWMAFGFAVAGIAVYFAALICIIKNNTPTGGCGGFAHPCIFRLTMVTS